MPDRPRRRRRQNLILDHLTALTNQEIRLFLKRHKIDGASAQAKDQLRKILRQSLQTRKITTKSVVDFLDEVTPWGKQHVYLYSGPAKHSWREANWVDGHLKAHGLDHLLNAQTGKLILPDTLEIASITVTRKRLHVTAIRKREGWVRDEGYDVTRKKGDDGRPLWLKGYSYQVLRGITAFEWNLLTNEAFLQVTQLPTTGSYEGVADEFKKKIAPWLDLSEFKLVDLRRAVKKLHELEEKGKGTAESHAADYSRLGRRRIAVRSTSTKVPLRGDRTVDGVLKLVQRDGIPRIGDFYFDGDGARTVAAGDGKPEKRRHVIIMAEKGRINFATPGKEEGLRSVLTELRTLSGK